ncbi:helix-turn-helix domain-containing protein [Paenibacillus allorhizosphaerae]|uniref:HTH-type transcriptional activator RhaS n=1 Tax=Paenibacillus allorhizosphaerae TaxID=2849866 RepID=A0ABN7TFQ2_9BACL|nr:helix-turn-helix domain-containing protein [Paenibacillus allorhizosphaerae]CAG7627681.1 HTH-type transcriptional activator RhaS [Paenibacillus allorhizosphaerae]
MNVSLHLFHSVTRTADSYIHFHAHNGYEIVYYFSGNGNTQIDKEKFEYNAGCFAISEPGVKHDEYRRTSTDVIYLVFSCTNSAIPLQNGLYGDPDGTIGRLLHRMAAELSSKTKYYDILLRCLLVEVIVEIGRVTNLESTEEADNNLIYAKNYIEQYHGEKMDLQGLAKTLGYSYDYFRHLFKDYTGYSPMQYAVQQRLERAKQMLTAGKEPITAISIECGFSNSPQFCKMFKSQFGMSPKRFRETYSV